MTEELADTIYGEYHLPGYGKTPFTVKPCPRNLSAELGHEWQRTPSRKMNHFWNTKVEPWRLQNVDGYGTRRRTSRTPPRFQPRNIIRNLKQNSNTRGNNISAEAIASEIVHLEKHVRSLRTESATTLPDTLTSDIKSAVQNEMSDIITSVNQLQTNLSEKAKQLESNYNQINQLAQELNRGQNSMQQTITSLQSLQQNINNTVQSVQNLAVDVSRIAHTVQSHNNVLTSHSEQISQQDEQLRQHEVSIQTITSHGKQYGTQLFEHNTTLNSVIDRITSLESNIFSENPSQCPTPLKPLVYEPTNEVPTADETSQLTTEQPLVYHLNLHHGGYDPTNANHLCGTTPQGPDPPLSTVHTPTTKTVHQTSQTEQTPSLTTPLDFPNLQERVHNRSQSTKKSRKLDTNDGNPTQKKIKMTDESVV